MKRKDNVSAPVRCYCSANGATIDDRGHFAHVRITERISACKLAFRRALGKRVYRERSLGWVLSRGMLVLVAIAAMLLLAKIGGKMESDMDMPRSKMINPLSTADRNSVLDSIYVPQAQSIRQYFCQ